MASVISSLMVESVSAASSSHPHPRRNLNVIMELSWRLSARGETAIVPRGIHATFYV
jgi:hypothetical protein